MESAIIQWYTYVGPQIQGLGMKSKNVLLLMICISFYANDLPAQSHRDKKVRADREQLADDQRWYYDDLETGFGVARRDNKPLMIVLRCIP